MNDLINTDLYEVLGVASDADASEISRAYRALARAHHPDVNQDDPDAEERFKEISAAYDVLGDAEKRAEYDEFQSMLGQGFSGDATQSGGFDGSGAATDLDDLLASLFGSRGGPAGSSGFGSVPMRGPDVTGDIEIGFDESIRGTTVSLTLPDGRSVNANIPAGVAHGQTVRLAAQGLPGLNGGPNGDVLLGVHVRPDPRFERRGDDLVVEVAVDYPTAVLGGEVAVPTFDGGAVKIRVPAGTPAGRTFRIPRRGVVLGSRSGDLLARTSIAVPVDPGPELRTAVEAVREQLAAPSS